MNDFYKIQNKSSSEILVGNKLLIKGKSCDLEVSTHMPNNFDLNNENINNPDILIMCHPHPLYQGSMDNKIVTSVISSFNQAGALAVRFNFRGVGKRVGVYYRSIVNCPSFSDDPNHRPSGLAHLPSSHP